MKDFIIKNKLYIILFSFILIIIISTFIKCLAMDDYEKIDYQYGIVNTDYLNMRCGSDISFKSIDLLTRNEYVRIYGKIGDWLIVQNNKNNIGTVHSRYIELTNELKEPASNIEEIKETSAKPLEETPLTKDEEILYSLINSEREKNNLSSLKIDSQLQDLARLKAHDLVENNYFSHISPIYGTPFEMLKTNNINYKTASENIAGNKDINEAFKSWISSESHKNNILSNSFNYTGIGVVDSIAYGKIIVELFIGR